MIIAVSQRIGGIVRIAGILLARAVIRGVNPVRAVFALIGSFLCGSIRRRLVGRELRSLLFIRIYVGAIAVLFLFVVRRLSITEADRSQVAADRRSYRPVLLLAGSAFLGTRYAVLASGLADTAGLRDGVNAPTATVWVDALDRRNELTSRGQVLYTSYASLFLVAGFVLLTARVAVVSLVNGIPTGARVGVRRQQVPQQRARDPRHALRHLRSAPIVEGRRLVARLGDGVEGLNGLRLALSCVGFVHTARAARSVGVPQAPRVPREHAVASVGK